jgi:transketolase
MLSAETERRLRQRAWRIRRLVVEMVHRARSGHIGGSLGAADLLAALYHHLMRHDPRRPAWPERDRFVLSKGHCTPVLYATLADCGYFPVEDLAAFRRPGSHLQGHPYAPKTPGVDASTGTLGLGLSTAAGMALGGKLRGEPQRYYVLCGDGELQEGQIWEAALFAHKYALDNVIAFCDRNGLQTDGPSESVMPLEPLEAKWRAFGWHTEVIDGHDFAQIAGAVEAARAAPGRGRPTMIIARTVKGRGVSFMENQVGWHAQIPTDEEYARAMEELA